MRIRIFIVVLAITSCSPKKETINNPTLIEYRVVNSFPHSKLSFTQGFVIHQGELYESTGQEDSWIGVVNIKTGEADKKVILEKDFFGEGITILNKKIYQLTWKNKKGFVYDLKTFETLKEFEYSTEGWGLTHNNAQLIMSNGSSKLLLLDTTTLQVSRTIDVTYSDQPITYLNELEFIDGYVYANIWQSNLIAKININTGQAEGFIDLSQLAQQVKLINPKADVLNGIAWHEETKSLLVTGKYWPFIYVIKLKDSL